METLQMSGSERERLKIMAGVAEAEVTLVAAAGLLGVCYRQSKRIWRRYQDEGDAGLVHRLRGKASARRKPAALREQVLALCAEERYEGFGPTLMAEHLLKAKLEVDHETLRRWRIATGKHTVRQRKAQHRQWRERRPCFGEMVQLDGSHHDWFEGRGPKCVLMVMVDDATNRMYCRFFEEETTRASYDVLEGWIKQHGLPGSLYVDRDSIYRCEGVASIAEQLLGKAPQTQFGRAMEQLGIKLILANSPQAKGRVERMNGTLQDRLVKEMRLLGIKDLAGANRFLDGKYLRGFNRQFGRAAAQPLDAHRKNTRRLQEVLSWEVERVVQGDWTVACEAKRYQLDQRHEALSLVRRKVIVRTWRNGRVQLVYRGKPLQWRALPAGAAKKSPPGKKTKAAQKEKPQRAGKIPAQNHPWRRDTVGAGRKYWSRIKAQGRATRLALRDSGRPPLRSGLPTSRRASRKNRTTKQPTKGTFFREL
jgi:Helix-turn-helix domain